MKTGGSKKQKSKKQPNAKKEGLKGVEMPPSQQRQMRVRPNTGKAEAASHKLPALVKEI